LRGFHDDNQQPHDLYDEQERRERDPEGAGPQADPECVDDGAVRRPEARALLPRVTVHEDPAIATGANPIEDGHVDVEIRLRGGTALTRRVTHPRGSPADPLRADELAAKFHDCAAGVLDPERAEAALARLRAVEAEPDVRRLVELLTPAAVAAR